MRASTLTKLSLLQIADSGSPIAIPEPRSFVCEFPECSAVSYVVSFSLSDGHVLVYYITSVYRGT